jgi:hypothetical protein
MARMCKRSTKANSYGGGIQNLVVQGLCPLRHMIALNSHIMATRIFPFQYEQQLLTSRTIQFHSFQMLATVVSQKIRYSSHVVVLHIICMLSPKISHMLGAAPRVLSYSSSVSQERLYGWDFGAWCDRVSLSVSLIVKESATKQHGKCSLIVRNQRKQVLCGLLTMA